MIHSYLEAWASRAVHRGSYMSAHVLLNLLNELGKAIKCEAMFSLCDRDKQWTGTI